MCPGSGMARIWPPRTEQGNWLLVVRLGWQRSLDWVDRREVSEVSEKAERHFVRKSQSIAEKNDLGLGKILLSILLALNDSNTTYTDLTKICYLLACINGKYWPCHAHEVSMNLFLTSLCALYSSVLAL